MNQNGFLIFVETEVPWNAWKNAFYLMHARLCRSADSWCRHSFSSNRPEPLRTHDVRWSTRSGWIFYVNGWRCFRNGRFCHRLHISPFWHLLYITDVCLRRKMSATVIFYQNVHKNAREKLKESSFYGSVRNVFLNKNGSYASEMGSEWNHLRSIRIWGRSRLEMK